MRERFDPLSRHHDGSDRLVLAQQRYTERGMYTRERCRFAQRVFRVGREIEDVDRPLLQHGASADVAPIHCQRMGFEELDEFLAVADGRSGAVKVRLAAHDEGHLCIA